MKLFSLPTDESARPFEWQAQAALSGVIGTVGDGNFGALALAHINRCVPLACWSVYSLFDRAPPVLHAHASREGLHDSTPASWRMYRESLYRRDVTFTKARELTREGGMVLLHWNADEIPAEHRSAIYSPNGLRERLSVVIRVEEDGLLAVNLYRHRDQSVFGAQGIDALSRVALPLVACVHRHIELRAKCAVEPSPLDALTKQESAVCERLLKGWTQQGVAADLGISPATVKTYRDRAFRRLGIRFRHQLFALIAKPDKN